MRTTYTLVIDTDRADDNLHADLRDAIGYMGETVDPEGDHYLSIDLLGAAGDHVAGYFYDPPA